MLSGLLQATHCQPRIFMNDECELISRVTRADALAEGVLVDVTTTAKEAGIKYPTAVTNGHQRCLREIRSRSPRGRCSG